jgi:hypothetical protein
MNNKPYFLFLKTLLSLFVNDELALRPGDWFSGNTFIRQVNTTMLTAAMMHTRCFISVVFYQN